MSLQLRNGQVSVGTSATQIVAGRPREDGSVTIINHGTTDVYVGTGGVSTTNGALLSGVKGASITISTDDPIYAIVGTGTQTVSYVETY